MEITNTQITELKGRATFLLDEAQPVLLSAESSAEDKQAARAKVERAMALKVDIDTLLQIKDASKGLMSMEIHDNQPPPEKPTGFKTLGEYLVSVYSFAFHSQRDQRLKAWSDQMNRVAHYVKVAGGTRTRARKTWLKAWGPLVGS